MSDEITFRTTREGDVLHLELVRGGETKWSFPMVVADNDWAFLVSILKPELVPAAQAAWDAGVVDWRDQVRAEQEAIITQAEAVMAAAGIVP